MQSIKKSNKLFKSIILTITLIISFSACSSKEEQIYNKSATYWYNELIKAVNVYDLDKADDSYTSLNSEHKNSPLIATSLIILATAHVEEENYELANYYLDEYLKRFALSKNVDYVRFFKIKSKYLAFNSEFRNQKLVSDILKEINTFLQKFPNSIYLPLVETMNTRLTLARNIFDEEIAGLYERVDKPKASQYYKNRVDTSWIDKKEVTKVETSWYRQIFQ